MYNFTFNGLDFSNPLVLIASFLLLIVFIFVSNKLILPIYDRYLQRKKKKNKANQKN